MPIGVIWDEIWDEAIWDNDIWLDAFEVTPPIITAASIGSNGTDLTLMFSEAVSVGAGGNAGFAITLTRGPATLTYASGDGTATYVYTINRVVDASEAATLDYVQPGNGIEDSLGDDLESFTGRAISNGSTQDAIPPTLQSALLDEAGDELTLQFNENVTIGAGGNAGFTIDMSGGAATVTYSSGDGGRTLVYTTSRSIANTETGTLDYTQPGNGVEDIAGNDLATLADFSVLFAADLTHNRSTLRHMRTTVYHKDPTVTHNETDLGHNA